jgi:hypothetical protein
MPTLAFLFDFAAGSTNVGNGSAQSTFFFDDVKYANVPLSADEPTALANARIYPNPTASSWTFDAPAGVPMRVDLLDLNGKPCATAEGEGPVRLYATHLPAGLYWAKIQLGETVRVERVSKMD